MLQTINIVDRINARGNEKLALGILLSDFEGL